ncbi:MAG: YkgJ family cysteine cluster protein [Deltaproteobacteria bacterium]|nr:YkgJ family cysteine cluster protein [Deltaproteobacteria bacterium]
MPTFEPLPPDGSFEFFCGPQNACFNRCCRDLNHYLTPYDILRLKHRLCLPSQKFLKYYTELHRGPESGLPVVSLKMSSDQSRACPFVTSTGCRVYEDRPTACRTYPLGRMVCRNPGETTCRESYFLIKEAHCLGFDHPNRWTIAQWKKNEDIAPYNQMNDLIMDIIVLMRQRRAKPLTDLEVDRFCMACYDLDRFRDFAAARNLRVPAECKAFVAGSLEADTALMRFGIEWIRDELFQDDSACGEGS